MIIEKVAETKTAANLTLNANANTITNSTVTVTGTFTRGANLVILGSSSASAGANDIVGIARRPSPTADSALKYNNQYTTINNANVLLQMEVQLVKASPPVGENGDMVLYAHT